MVKTFKWLVFAVLGIVVVLTTVAVTLNRWVHTDDFRQRVELEVSSALGVPTTVSSVAVGVWPLPSIVLSNVKVLATPQPLIFGRLEVRPQWQALLQRRFVADTLMLRRAELPQQSIEGLLYALQKKKQKVYVGRELQPESVIDLSLRTSPADWMPSRLVLDQATWVGLTGARTLLAGEMSLGVNGLPDELLLKLGEGELKGLVATLRREPGLDSGREPGSEAGRERNHASDSTSAQQPGMLGLMTGKWALHVELGDGQTDGTLSLQSVQSVQSRQTPVPEHSKGATATADDFVLQGQLQTRGVEMLHLTGPSHALAGKLDASTVLTARASTVTGMVDALQTRSSFPVRHGVLHGLDVARAIQTGGLSPEGDTTLDAFSGHVITQGRVLQSIQLMASSGLLRATGKVLATPAGVLGGEPVVVSADGGTAAAGITLAVGGTLDAPELGLSGSTVQSAVRGTAVKLGKPAAASATVADRVNEKLHDLFGK